MADSLLEQRASYPLAAYNFRVLLDAKAMSFARVSGLQREHQYVTYRHGLSCVEGELLAKYRVDKYVPVTLERGSTLGARALYDWLEDRKPRVLQIDLCDASGRPALAWRITRAFAVKLTGPSFDARTNEVAIDSLEVMAAGISIVHL
ncbi:MAG: phage tail protein [Nannocystis sp.]|nr:phage tail protein [Nannocystis sp.]